MINMMIYQKLMISQFSTFANQRVIKGPLLGSFVLEVTLVTSRCRPGEIGPLSQCDAVTEGKTLRWHCPHCPIRKFKTCYTWSKWRFPEMGGIPKSSILVRFSIINQPFGGFPILGNPKCFFFDTLESLVGYSRHSLASQTSGSFSSAGSSKDHTMAPEGLQRLQHIFIQIFL